MKILMLSDDFLPVIGGQQLAVHYLALELFKTGHAVTVLYYGPKPHQKNSKSFPYRMICFPSLFGKYRSMRKYTNPIYIAITTLLSLLLQKYDLIITSLYQVGFGAYIQKKIFGLPYMVWAHGVDIQIHYECKYGYRLDPIYNKRIVKIAQAADGCIASTVDIKNDFLSIGVKEEKIIDAPHGIVLIPSGKPIKADVRKKLKILDNEIVLFSASRYHPKKNLELAVDCLDILNEKINKYKLIICGDHLHRLRAKRERSKYRENIYLLPALSGENLEEVFVAADIYIFPSRIESFGLVILEAWRMRIPIVAAMVPGIQSVVVHEKTGLLHKDNDAVDMAQCVERLADPILRQNVIEEASRQVKNYTWKNTAKILLEYISNYSGSW
jgi:glycosyltransferase involved in cell wall biosynthesis